jgi:deoxyribodipyrimidine photolyase-related protein
MATYIIFPNQLFELRYFLDTYKPKVIHLVEEPVFFGYRENKLNFNKLKLILHRASMKYYENYLKKNKIEVHYHEFDDVLNSLKSKVKASDNLCTFELNDHYLEKKVKKNFPNIKFLENPNFVVSLTQLNKYYEENKKKKTVNQGHFYNWVKSEINVLIKSKSYDTENRNPLPDSVKIPVLGRLPLEDKKYLKEAIEYVSRNPHFKDNCGPSESELVIGETCWFPVTHKGAHQWLQEFIKNRLTHFGDYQDAIRQESEFKYKHLFHSLIAPMFNIGLISPHQIVEEVMDSNTKYGVKMNNIEGFIRQIVGWREYQRYCYLHYYDKMTKANIFGNNRKLTKELYEGTTGIPPVDDAIKSAFQYGYLHHIQRLMVMSNYFNLLDIHPDEAYKWFMEFSLDSYDWLMIQNVYSMGMWADGGLSMRKPYISTAGYILNMSNYKKPKQSEIKAGQKDWTEVWKSLFYSKLMRHKHIFEKTPYVIHLKKKLQS